MAVLRSGSGTGSARRGNSSRGMRTISGASNTDNLETPDRRGTRQAWYFRKGRVPAGVPIPDVRFDFITKEGYGKSVLQKEQNVLQALGQAADNARRYKSLN